MDTSCLPEYVMNNLCRICAEKSPKLNRIFEWDSLPLKIYKCLSIELSESDYLPLSVCETCFFKIHDSYTFYETAHQADEKLKKLWKTLLKETMVHYPEIRVECNQHIENNLFLIEEPPDVSKLQEESLSDLSPNLVISVQEDVLDDKPQLEDITGEVIVIGKTTTLEICADSNSEIFTQSVNEEDGSQIQIQEILLNEPLEENKIESSSLTNPINNDPKCLPDSNQESTVESSTIQETSNLEERPFLCDICGKSFKNSNSLKCHVKIHAETRNKYGCKICNKSFLTNYFLKEHMNLHTGETPYKCTVCGKEFREKVHLRHHKWTHSDIEFKCPLCNSKFSRKGNLMEHIKKHHKNSAKKNNLPIKKQPKENNSFACPACNSTFSSQILLKNHLVTHPEQKRYFCAICGKKFRHSGSLTYHRRTAHTGEKPFVCNYCDEKFSLRSVQMIHERKKHTFEYPYKCSFCSRPFADSSSLRNHSFTHSEEKEFGCDECGKKFSRSSNLLIHKKLHSNDRQFSCDQCEKRYIQKHDLIKHKKIHDPKSKPFFCKYCGNSFSHKKDSSKHAMCQFDFLRKTNCDISSAEKILETVTSGLEKSVEEQLILESVKEFNDKNAIENDIYQDTTDSLNPEKE